MNLPHCGPRTHEVAALLMLGTPDKVIAQRLKMSESTVSYHVSRILAVTGSDNRTQAAVALARAA